jgi:uncharacterized protein (TIGR03083 family)
MTDVWTHARYCDETEREIARFVALIDYADPGARVATCPDWTVTGLAEHLGGGHRWTSAMVSDVSQKPYPYTSIPMELPGDPAAYPEWLTAGGEALVAVLRAADPDAPMWAWGADQHVRFWSRRMLHETTVHRADAEWTVGAEPEVDAGVAIDGIDEFLENLTKSRSAAPKIASLTGESTGTIALTAGDASWLVTLGADGFTWRRCDAVITPADVTVRAAADDLLLFVYGRRTAADPRVETAGSAALLEGWTRASVM